MDHCRPSPFRYNQFGYNLNGPVWLPFYNKEISVIGSRALLPEDMRPSIDLVASGAIDVKGFITATYPLTHAAEAFEEYERNPSRILRIVIDSGS